MGQPVDGTRVLFRRRPTIGSAQHHAPVQDLAGAGGQPVKATQFGLRESLPAARVPCSRYA
jgi:hypothetical protein